MTTQEKSEHLALQVELIKLHCTQIDWDYVRATTHEFFSQASFQDAIAVLKPSHSQLKQNELLREQAHALRSLTNFYDTLLKCGEMKAEITTMAAAEEKIQSLFL